MDVIAFLALAIALISYDKIYRLEQQIKKLKRKTNDNKSMSKILSGFIGKKCVLVSEYGNNIIAVKEIPCTVLDVDEDWIKYIYITEQGFEIVQTIRIENINKVFSAKE